MKLEYIQNGDYQIPNLVPDQEPEEMLTKYGQMRMNYLREYRSGIYQGLLLSGELKSHCLEIQKQAEQRMDLLISQMAGKDNVNERLKEQDPLLWTARMNNIRQSAEEIVQTELIYI